MEQIVSELNHHPFVRRLKMKHPEFDDTVQQLHLARIYQAVKEYDHCSACPGLDQCPNDLQGHYTQLTVEPFGETSQVVEKKVSCKKYIANQTQKNIHKRIRSFYLDDDIIKRGYTVSEIYERDSARSKAVEQITDYVIKTLQQGLQSEGLYLVGDFGTGKTFLMTYMLNELAKEGFTGVIVYVPDLIEDLKTVMKNGDKLNEMMDTMKEADLLVFDDIGAENLNPWARDHVIGTILNYRMNRKPTFFTSNYDLKGLQKHFCFTDKEGQNDVKGRRLMERIEHFVQVITVSGENQRGK